MRIEVGYGLEGTLTDALSKIILTSAVAPRFKARDYGAGIERGVEGIIEVLSGDSAEWTKRARGPQSTTFDELSPLIFFALFLFIVVWMARSARGRQRVPAELQARRPPFHRIAPERRLLGG